MVCCCLSGVAVLCKMATRLNSLLGRRKLLQCLLSVRRTLNQTEPFYVMNDLYVTDYCIWVQKASPKQIRQLAVELDEVTATSRACPMIGGTGNNC